MNTPALKQGQQTWQPASAAAWACRVLVVDDNRDAGHSLAELLRLLGHAVVVADDGSAALALLEGGRSFDVALLDIDLPGISGHELARRLRQRLPRHALRLVALSGYDKVPDPDTLRGQAFDDYFVKPVDIDALMASIGKAGRAAA